MKALIITSNRYPRSGAASNYIQYFASMLKLGGCDVTVAGVRNESVLCGNKRDDNDIIVIDVIPQGNDFIKRVLNKCFYKMMLDRIIRYLNIGKEDLVIDYSYDYRIYETILKLRKKKEFFSCLLPYRVVP